MERAALPVQDTNTEQSVGARLEGENQGSEPVDDSILEIEPEFHTLERRLDQLYQRAGGLPPGTDEETQDELGLLLQLLPAVERSGDYALLNNIELAVQALLVDPPNRLLAIRLREACQQRVLGTGFLRSIMPGSSASTWVIVGMAALLFIAIPLVALVTYFFVPDREFLVGPAEFEHSFEFSYLVMIGLAGALGSVVSILVRIKDFSEVRILNPPALFWTGFFKPIIGAVFALFVFAAFGAGLIFVNEAVDEVFMYLAFAFVAGFSERFAPDLVSRLERSIGGPGTSERPKP